jgi:hypothetical protein
MEVVGGGGHSLQRLAKKFCRGGAGVVGVAGGWRLLATTAHGRVTRVGVLRPSSRGMTALGHPGRLNARQAPSRARTPRIGPAPAHPNHPTSPPQRHAITTPRRGVRIRSQVLPKPKHLRRNGPPHRLLAAAASQASMHRGMVVAGACAGPIRGVLAGGLGRLVFRRPGWPSAVVPRERGLKQAPAAAGPSHQGTKYQPPEASHKPANERGVTHPSPLR